MSVIQSFLTKNPSLIVTKPGCPFCQSAIEMLDKNKVQYKEFDYEEEKELVEAIKQEKRHKTFPMIFIDTEFVGGYDQLKKRYERKASTRSNGL